MPRKPVVLCILDGWGLNPATEGNAVAQAQTPTYDHIMATRPNATLITHGPDAGLPSGQMGNSEVGHTNIGAGRVVAMDLGQIDLAIEDGSFFENPRLQAWIQGIVAKGGIAHLMGLISDGGVHGHLNHMIAAARACTQAGLQVQIHAIGDGRDVAPQSIQGYLAALETALPEGAQIGSLIGRYYAMDRDKRWERVSQAYALVTGGEGAPYATAEDAVEAAYAADLTDEFLPASRLASYVAPQDGDGFFCLNFRADRAREIMAALGDPAFNDFSTSDRPAWSGLLGMADYSEHHSTFMQAMFPKPEIVNTLGAWVAHHGRTQFRLAETEKYPHVTFFLNGGVEPPFEGEDRHMPKSPKVATYDLQPEMSANEVTDALCNAIAGDYDLIVVNYANPDMVGHTGDLAAAAKACEAVDQGLARVLEALQAAGGAMIMCADHGNCEVMIDPETGAPHTAHTTNLVPVALIGAEGTLKGGRLADLAPTILQLMGLPQPPEMTGVSLLS